MLKNPQFKNIEKYKDANKGIFFNLYDYIYHEIEVSKINLTFILPWWSFIGQVLYLIKIMFFLKKSLPKHTLKL